MSAPVCLDVGEVLVTNGVIHTMDDAGTVVDSARIASGRIKETGNGLQASGCGEVIDLKAARSSRVSSTTTTTSSCWACGPVMTPAWKMPSPSRKWSPPSAPRAAAVPRGNGSPPSAASTATSSRPRRTRRASRPWRNSMRSPRNPSCLHQESFAGPGVTNRSARPGWKSVASPAGENGEVATGRQQPGHADAVCLARHPDPGRPEARHGRCHALRRESWPDHPSRPGRFSITGTDADGANMDPTAPTTPSRHCTMKGSC